MLEKVYLGSTPLGFHKIAYTEWGHASQRPSVLCIHGLARNGRDFDRLAESLQDKMQIFCPDMVGRGKSDWLSDPAYYTYSQYVNDLTALMARMDTKSMDWVGTSMGGLIGMVMASMPNTPIRRLVINDVGPVIAEEAVRRIASYVSITPEFEDVAAIERYLRQIYAPFGITRDEDWRHMAKHSAHILPNGKLTLARDSGISKNFVANDKPFDIWNVYDQIKCPVLLLRGAQSDILSSATADAMTKRGPKAQLIEIPNVGHAPALMDKKQIQMIENFLAD